MLHTVLELEKQDNIALLRLNRPEVHNAVDDRMMAAFESVLDELAGDPEIGVIILTGAGPETFCAGGDARYFATLKTREEALKMSQRMQVILDRLWSGNTVVIGAINGQALGGGCEILTACHLRVAAEHARFSFRQAANGIITGWGGGVRLFGLLGQQRALRLFLTAETIDAAEALRIHFIDEIVPADKLLARTFQLAESILANSRPAIQAFLHIARQVAAHHLPAAEESETRLFANLWMGEDFRAWLNNFLSKSRAEFFWREIFVQGRRCN